MFGDAGVLLRGGQGYRNFTQTSDDEVIALLDRARDSFAEAVAIDAADPPLRDEEVRVLAGPVTVAGHLTIPEHPRGIVVFRARQRKQQAQPAQSVCRRGLEGRRARHPAVRLADPGRRTQPLQQYFRQVGDPGPAGALVDVLPSRLTHASRIRWTGGHLAQLVAARRRHVGVVAACPSAAAGIRPPACPAVLDMLIVQYLQPRPWAKPLYPTTWRRFRQWIANAQTEELAREVFADLVCESGRVHCEIGFPRLDRAKAATVNFAAITSPVLAIAGGCDRLVPARIARQTAGRYQKGTYVEIPRADHFHGPHRQLDRPESPAAPPPNVDRLVAGAPRYNINSHLLNTHHYSCC